MAWVRHVWVAGLLCLVGVSGRGQEAPTPQKPPKFAVLTKVERLTLTFVSWTSEVVFEQRAKEVTENGQTKTVTYTVANIVERPCQFTLSQNDVTGTTVSGEELASGRPWKMRTGKSMLLLGQNEKLDSVYLAALAPETVIVKLKNPLPQPQPAPPPASTSANDPASTAPPEPLSPVELAQAQKAIQPELLKLKIKVAPSPLTDPVLQSALPGFVFFPVDTEDDDNGKKRPNRKLVVKKPDGTASTLSQEEGSIFDLLKDQFTVLTEADARKYVRTHLLLVEAGHPQFKFGPIDKLTVTPTDRGGLQASGEAPILSGGTAGSRPLAFVLNVTFGKDGQRLGGKRTARFE